MKVNYLLLNFFFLVSAAVGGCEESDAAEPLNELDFKVTGIEVVDMNDNGNASDLSIRFTAARSTQINHYKIMIALASVNVDTSPENLTALEQLPSNRFMQISSDDSDRNVSLPSSQQTIDGTAIENGNEYHVYILTSGTHNGNAVLVLSEPSLAFVLEDNRAFDLEALTVQNISLQDVDNDGNASDYQASFDAPEYADLVTNYKIMLVADGTQAPTLESAKSIDNSAIQLITSDDSKVQVELRSDLSDIDGNTMLVEDKNYSVFVLTESLFRDEVISTLSESSNLESFIIRPETSTLVPGFRGNGSITLDSEGNIYVNEFGQGSGNAGLGTSAFKITPEGEVTEFLSDLSGPVGNAHDDEGNYYFNDGNEGSEGVFTRYSPDGIKTDLVEIPGYPTNILFTKENDFLVANWITPVINKVSKTGDLSVFAQDVRLAGCTGIVHGEGDEVLVGNFSTGLIMSISSDGIITEIGTIPTVIAGFVIGYIDYFEGHIYATGYGSNKIYKMNREGRTTEFTGTGQLQSVDDELAKASFQTPNGIAIDKERRLMYVTQNGNGVAYGLRVIPL
ncbi:MAG: hypothetical protein AAF789_01080 [Bacteroidota bacterium]